MCTAFLPIFYLFTFIIMKNLILILAIISLTILGGCSASEAPLTEKQMAEKNGMSMEEYKETKEAAARMNMSVDEHVKMDD